MPRRNSKHLTDPGIEKIGKAPPGIRLERFDAGVDGLALRITDTGSKSWSVYYRWKGKNTRLTLGAWTRYSGSRVGLTVAEARQHAQAAKDRVKAGMDPKAVVEEAKKAAQAEDDAKMQRTFGAIAKMYIEREVPRLVRGKETQSIIGRQLLPVWRDRDIAKIRKRDARKLTDELVQAGKPAAAYRLHETIVRLFNFALEELDEDILGFDVSPMANLKPPVKKSRRDRKLSHGEIKTLWTVWEELGAPFGDVQKLLLLTGQRRSEIAGMQWSELDNPDKPRVWTLPGARSKSRREHIVPLSKRASDILTALPRYAEGDHVFTTTNGRRPVAGFSKAKRKTDELVKAVRKEDKDLAAVKPWRWHDLRRTFRSELARLGVSDTVAERAINHLPQGLAAVYNVHEYRKERADALELWGQEVTAIVEPPPNNVVAMKRKA